MRATTLCVQRAWRNEDVFKKYAIQIVGSDADVHDDGPQYASHHAQQRERRSLARAEVSSCGRDAEGG
jgi:hypothetical protein